VLARGGPLRRPDITVHASDKRRAPGHLSRQGPPALRWVLYEAARAARRSGSPDRDYYLQAAARLGGNQRCCLSCASSSNAAITHLVSSATTHSHPPETNPSSTHQSSRHRCTAPGSRRIAAATFASTASKDGAAATLQLAEATRHQPSCHVAGREANTLPRTDIKPWHPRARDDQHRQFGPLTTLETNAAERLKNFTQGGLTRTACTDKWPYRPRPRHARVWAIARVRPEPRRSRRPSRCAGRRALGFTRKQLSATIPSPLARVPKRRSQASV